MEFRKSNFQCDTCRLWLFPLCLWCRTCMYGLVHGFCFIYFFECVNAIGSMYPGLRARGIARDPRSMRACVRVLGSPTQIHRRFSFQIKQISEAWKYHALRKSPKHSASVPRPRPRRGTKPREMYTEVS